MANNYHLATATISSGGGAPSNSSAVDLQRDIPSEFTVRDITVHGATAHSSTVVVQVDATSTGEWRNLIETDSTNRVKIPAGGSRHLGNISAPRIRIQSATGESSTRVFEFWTQ